MITIPCSKMHVCVTALVEIFVGIEIENMSVTLKKYRVDTNSIKRVIHNSVEEITNV